MSTTDYLADSSKIVPLDQSNKQLNHSSISSINFSFFINRLRANIWLLGVPSWLFGITDRGVAAFADTYLSAIEITHLLTVFFFFVSWLYLKPEDTPVPNDGDMPRHYPRHQKGSFLDEARQRMMELEEYHLITQEYTLPFPYLCQLYHLLNLKHLENVHSFSLNNLRIVQVCEFQPTQIGGLLKFQTVADSPLNALRIWRQPVVEVELVLQTPYTVELRIPVYNGKKIIVLFNVLPLNQNEHKLFIDIYSNLSWPRLPLQVLLHIASCLTLFEDLPYLRKLAKRNLTHLMNTSRSSSHETMVLFRRFVDLYGPILETP